MMVDTIPKFSRLFNGIEHDEGIELMNNLGATIRDIPKGGIVLHEGSIKRNIGLVIDGSLEMYETDSDGQRVMVGRVYPPNVFATVFAFAAVECHPCTVAAIEDSCVLVIPIGSILPKPGVMVNPVHHQFLLNLLSEICEKAWNIRSRTFILSRRSIVEKLLTYLRQQMHAVGSNDFKIPYNRQELADFLCVDRSALSSVISKLARKGVFTYKKNHFVLSNKVDFSRFSSP